MGDGSIFDIQYIPGSGGGSGWSAEDFGYWLKNYRPGPATINGVLEVSSNDDPTGAQAHVGDRLYDALDTMGSGVDVIAYMQVVEVRAANVVVDMWIWNRN